MKNSKKIYLSLFLVFLSFELIISQTTDEDLEAECTEDSIDYKISINLTKYLENENNIDKRDIFSSADDLKDKPVGVYEGSSFDGFTNTIGYGSVDEVLKDMRAHKIDAFICDSATANYTQITTNDLTVLPGSVGKIKIGYACQKNSEIFNKLVEYLAENADNVMNTYYKWMGINYEGKYIDKTLTGTNGVINAMFIFSNPPYVYIENGEQAGCQIDTLYDFARKYGYKLNIKEATNAGELTTALEKGEIDITNILMVDELKDKFSFHEVPELEMKVMVRYSNTKNSTKWAIYDKIEDFNGETLACYHGYSFEYLFEEKFPKSTVVQKGNSFDLLYALIMNEIQGFLTDETVAQNFQRKFPERVTYFKIEGVDNNLGFGFKKDDTSLLEEFNTFLKTIDKDALYKKWNADDTSSLTVQLDDFTGTKTIKAGFLLDPKPFSYIENGMLKGYEIDLLYQFANKQKYNIEFSGLTDLDDRLKISDYDITGGLFTITDERAKSVTFSDPIFDVGVALTVRTDSKKDSIKLSVLNEDFSTSSDNDADIKVKVGGEELDGYCTFPEIYSDEMEVKCSIEYSDIDPLTQGLESISSTSKLNILYSYLEIENLLNGNKVLGKDDIVKESDKSKAFCTEIEEGKSVLLDVLKYGAIGASVVTAIVIALRFCF